MFAMSFLFLQLVIDDSFVQNVIILNLARIVTYSVLQCWEPLFKQTDFVLIQSDHYYGSI